jgi:hypothetical protein
MLIQQYHYWTDKYGLITGFPHRKESGNGPMYTGEYAYALYLVYKNKGISSMRYNNELKKITKVLYRCQVAPGLFRHAPGGHYSKIHNTPDDYWGIALAAHICRNKHASQWLAWGRANYFNFNDQQPDKWRWGSWMGRMPHLICHFQLAAGEKPNLFRIAFWVLALFSSLFKPKRSQDSWVKAWMMCKVGEQQLGGIVSLWRFFFKRRLPGGMGEVRKAYGFPKQHPSVVYLCGDY